MIDPNTIHTLSNLTRKGLAVVLADSGYSGCSFKHATFMGINPDGHFVYEVEYYDEMGTGEDLEGYVFVSYDHEKGAIKADF